MRAIFLTALNNIHVPEDLGRGDRLSDSVFLTNRFRASLKHYLDESVVRTIGILEAKAILNAKAIVYSVEDQSEDADPQVLLTQRMRELSAFENILWLSQDCCVDHELGFLITYPRGGTKVDSNYLGRRYSLANGKIGTKTFPRAALKALRRFHRERIQMPDFAPEAPTLLTSSLDRVSRSMYILQGARIANDLGFKISSYCAALEALFATSQTEIAHQLAERVGWFLGKDGAERLSIYSTMKRAYSVRSKVAHGDGVKSSRNDSLASLAGDCDANLRRCLQRLLDESDIYSVFTGPTDKLDEYLMGLVLASRGQAQA
ncbi:MAG: hypothetical protein ACRD1X_04925 [Vicinamibacteria bacterium]